MAGNKITVEVTVQDNQVLTFEIANNLAIALDKLSKNNKAVSHTIKVHSWNGNEPVTR